MAIQAINEGRLIKPRMLFPCKHMITKPSGLNYTYPRGERAWMEDRAPAETSLFLSLGQHPFV